MEEPWVTMKDIASHVGVTPETIRNWIKTKVSRPEGRPVEIQIQRRRCVDGEDVAPDGL